MLIDWMQESWKKVLIDEFKKSYFINLMDCINKEIHNNITIYPHPENIFAAINLTPFESVKVVILGQDPYHGADQAHGLAFSVQKWIKYPPSLRNIFKEIQDDIGNNFPENGDLTRWSNQGVLLLNTTLTVRARQPLSHAGLGWEIFTDAIISKISEKKDFVIFLLWWSHAQKKKVIINTNKHIILESPHPSPLSSYRGFFWCKHFSKTNEILKLHGLKEIMW